MDIELSKSVNVIAGPNNAGKSTVLKSVYLLQDPYAFRDQDLRINTDQSGVKIILEDISPRDALLFRGHSKGVSAPSSFPYAEVFFPRAHPIAADTFYASTEELYDLSLSELNLEQRRTRFQHKSIIFLVWKTKVISSTPFLAEGEVVFYRPRTRMMSTKSWTIKYSGLDYLVIDGK